MIPHRRHRTQVGVAAPRVYVIDLLEDTVDVVEPPPDGVYEGQPAFSPVRPRLSMYEFEQWSMLSQNS